MKELAKRLQEEYKIEGRNIVPKHPVKVKIKREGKDEPEEIDITDKMWVLGNSTRSNKNLIVNCTKILKHTGALYLKRIAELEFKEDSYKLIKEPSAPDLHGYATIETTNGTVGDGEVHKSTLQASMQSYPYTMLKKRTVDRAILLELGLYEEGFYSEVEITPEMLMGEDIIITDNKKEELIEKVLKANQYLNQNEKALKEFVAGITGRPLKDIDIVSMTTDILARVYNELAKLCKEELKHRQELVGKIWEVDKTVPKKSLIENHSSGLEKALTKLEKKD